RHHRVDRPDRRPGQAGPAATMRFADLEETSRRIAATSARSQKVALLASLLRRLEPREIDATVAFLSGQLRQGRIGLGPAAIREAAGGPAAAAPTLALLAVDEAFDRIAGLSGPGSTAGRARLLAEMMGRATEAE